jgi:hypothetical protein
VDELRQATPEEIATFNSRSKAAFDHYVAAIPSPEKRAEVTQWRALYTSEVDKVGLIVATASPLLGLSRPTEFATWVIDVSTELPPIPLSEGGSYKRDPWEILVEGVGRAASIEIVKRLRASPSPDAQTEARLLRLLEVIEGPAAQAFLESPTTLPQFRTPVYQDAGPPLRFMLIPALPSSDYAGHDPRAVARLCEEARVVDPAFDATALLDPTRSQKELQRMKELGDIAFCGQGMLVMSGAFRSLGTNVFASLPPRLPMDLTRVPNGLVDDVSRRGAFLVLTADNRYAVVQILSSCVNDEIPIAYVVLEKGQTDLPVPVVPSLFSLVLRDPAPTFGAMQARTIYRSDEASYYSGRYRKVIPQLEDIIMAGSEATLEHRIAAVRLLGELRADESAIEMVMLLGREAEPILETAIIESLRLMVDRSRYAFVDQMQVASPERLARLRRCQIEVEGKAAAEAMWAYWKSQPRQQGSLRRPGRPAPQD